METTWLGKAEERGFKKGFKQGKAEVVEQMREAVLLGLEQRFGTVPQRVRRRLEAVGSVERLAAMVQKLLSAESIDDLLVPERAVSARSA